MTTRNCEIDGSSGPAEKDRDPSSSCQRLGELRCDFVTRRNVADAVDFGAEITFGWLYQLSVLLGQPEFNSASLGEARDEKCSRSHGPTGGDESHLYQVAVGSPGRNHLEERIGSVVGDRHFGEKGGSRCLRAHCELNVRLAIRAGER